MADQARQGLRSRGGCLRSETGDSLLATIMSDEFSQNDNPYASPNDPCPPGIDLHGRFESCRTVADLLDVGLYLSRAAACIGALLGILAAIVLICDWLSRFHGFFWFVGVALIAVVMHRIDKIRDREVKAVSVDVAGLHFHREKLPPDEWPWESITAIRLAARWEVVWYGWFRNLLKPRDPTACNSALGHYRIQAKADYCFFPPKNPQAFVEAIARFRPDLLPQGGE